jgi:hypothetical protein
VSRPSVAAAWWQSTATATAFHGAVVPYQGMRHWSENSPA